MKRMLVVSLVLLFSLVFVGAVLAQGNSVTIVSDTEVMVYGPRAEYLPVGDSAWGTSMPAVPTWVHPVWTDWTMGSDFTGATWISTSYLIGQDGGSIADDSWRWFTKTTDFCTGAYNISGTMEVQADNAVEVYGNGEWLVTINDVQLNSLNSINFHEVAFAYDQADALTLDFIVRNYAGVNFPEGNPTGLIFKADVDYDCPLMIEIDVKPGSFPSCFRNDGTGAIPVAIFGSEDLDVTEINPNSIKMDGLKVISKNKSGRLMVAYEDVNEDEYMDMVVKIEDAAGTYDPGMGTATLVGELGNGKHIMGYGDICIRGK
jgi:hypothetical protein